MNDRLREIEEDDAAERAIFGLVVLYGILNLLLSLKFLFIVGLATALAFYLL